MTTPVPESRVTAQTLEEFIGKVHVASGRRPPLGLLFCAESMPLDPFVICSRLDGHSGPHSSDGLLAWLDVDEPHDPDRRNP